MDRDSDFTAYVDARRTRLVRSAVLLGCPPHEGEDLVQTALVTIYRHWDRVSRAEDPDVYVYRILVSSFRDSRSRRWNAEQPVLDSTPGTDVRDALRRLPLDHRAVLVLRFYADLTNEQVATTLGLPVGTVKSRADRGLAALPADPALSALLHQAADEIDVPPGGPDLLELGWRAAERRLRINIILAAAAAVVVGLGVIAVAGRPTTPESAGGEVAVPDVRGLPQDDALARLRKAGFKAAVVVDNGVCRHPESTSTVPHPGESALPGSTVNLHVVGMLSDGCDLVEEGTRALRRIVGGGGSEYAFADSVEFFVDGVRIRLIPRAEVMDPVSWEGPGGANPYTALDESRVSWPEQGVPPTTCTGAKAALPTGVTEMPAAVTVATIWDAGDQTRVPECGEWWAIDTWVDDEGRLNRVNHRTR